jgi:hypothetical protein
VYLFADFDRIVGDFLGRRIESAVVLPFVAILIAVTLTVSISAAIAISTPSPAPATTSTIVLAPASILTALALVIFVFVLIPSVELLRVFIRVCRAFGSRAVLLFSGLLDCLLCGRSVAFELSKHAFGIFSCLRIVVKRL